MSADLSEGIEAAVEAMISQGCRARGDLSERELDDLRKLARAAISAFVLSPAVRQAAESAASPDISTASIPAKVLSAITPATG